MGFFSNYAAEYECEGGYIPHEEQMRWRVDALKERLYELTSRKTGVRDEGVCFSQEDLRYVLPEHFWSADDVRKAIALAEAFDPEDATSQENGITSVQLSFVDALLAHKAQCAA